MRPTVTQNPCGVVMIRPIRFEPNPETASDNRFQSRDHTKAHDVALSARLEVDCAARTLEEAGVVVHMFEDRGERNTPDAVFPNNWFSTHPCGTVVLYPTHFRNRRRERREDVIALLRRTYNVRRLLDYSPLEADGLALEGTGSMVLDHIGRIAYVARSRRVSEAVLARFCADLEFRPVIFDALDAYGSAIYHTNVMMCIASEFVIVALDSIDPSSRDRVQKELGRTGRDVIAINHRQVSAFAGNALEIEGASRMLVMSTRARKALMPDQIRRIERSLPIVALDVPTIELAGGSVRCMLAGVHLRSKHDSALNGHC